MDFFEKGLFAPKGRTTGRQIPLTKRARPAGGESGCEGFGDEEKISLFGRGGSKGPSSRRKKEEEQRGLTKTRGDIKRASP